MKWRILVCDPLSESGLKILQSDPLVECDVKLKQTPDQLLAGIGDYHAVIVRSETKITAPILKAAQHLKVVGRAGSGTDNIDVAVAKTLGIRVMNVPAGTTVAVAELAMTLMLALSRHVFPASSSLKKGEWKRSQFIGNELAGKRLGILGYGRIGKAVAHRARAFDMEVVAFDTAHANDSPSEEGMPMVPLNTLLQTSDIISIHLPLLPETKGMIGAPQFHRMKKGVKIINCARGGIVDERALYDALVEGLVSGAAIDVFEQEPPIHPHPLIELPQVLAMPHLGASTHESQARVGEMIAADVLNALRE